MSFTKEKFLNLKKTSQHKKIAEHLKAYHLNPGPRVFEEIQKMQCWMGFQPVDESDFESLSHHFHFHLQKADLGVAEADMLIKTSDRKKPKKPWLDIDIYLDHIRSAHNIGSILRTNEALRLGRILFSKKMAQINHLQVIKTSMGCSKLTPYSIMDESLNFEKTPLIALETSSKSIPFNEYTFPEAFTLILGNEEYGVSENLLKKADIILEIPLFGCKNSLNVCNAFSIVSWKISSDLRTCVK